MQDSKRKIQINIVDNLRSYFIIIQRALYNHEVDHIYEIEDWNDFYRFCSRQALLGLIFGEIERFGNFRVEKLPRTLLYRWMYDAERIKTQNQIVNNQLDALSQLLNSKSVCYSVIKGQIVARNYLRQDLRMSGDIDFYCSEKDVEKVKKLISDEWGVELDRGNSLRHYHFEYEGITFELHYQLFFFYQKKRDTYWQELLHNAMGYKVNVGDTIVSSLTPTVHTLYVFLHLYKHLIEVGVGLRQFCDLAMMLRTDVNMSELRQHLEMLGMTRVFRACEYILTDYLGLSQQYLPYKVRGIDRWFGNRMLSVILYRGNMGHYNKRNGWQGLGHQIESANIKMVHFIKFFWLSPRYHWEWMRNIVNETLKRLLKKQRCL